MESNNQKNWVVLPLIPAEISEKLSVFPPYMRQLLYNRGVMDEQGALEFLKPGIDRIDPFLLLDMEKAVDRLLQAINNQEPIAVYGDYDVDGVTATVLMVEVLRLMGGKVVPYIPNRFEEGYGLNTDAIQVLADSGVKVILTVDCGIRSPAEVKFAQDLHVDVIISDHHHPKEVLPEAAAVICQKREGDPYPYKELAGVGLAYKIAQALFERNPAGGSSADDWLDLVALGTVADIVPLTGENRMLVRRGLALIHQGRRKGLGSLIRVAGKMVEKVNASDIGFAIGPRLNAGGRIETALDSYQILISQDVMEIGSLAQKLNNHNSERQRQTKEIQQQAEAKFAERELVNLIADRDANYNSGVIGLVASKLVETYYRPAIVGSMEAEVTRASCRSISDFHITHALDQCADLLVRHGGHKAAAGFTVSNENWDALIQRLTEIADAELSNKDLRHTLKVDLDTQLDDLPKDILIQLKDFEPTGMENPEPLFLCRNVDCLKATAFGADKTHLKFFVNFHGGTLEAIAWRHADWLQLLPGKCDLVFSFEENNYGQYSTQRLNIRDLRASQTQE